ncbi:hypothetical protein GCM10028862_03180 [Luteimonas pelagia]
MTALPEPARAILVRVGADQSFGKWNGPCNPRTGDFVYVPIPQNRANAPGMARDYSIVTPALQAFSASNNVQCELPAHLTGQRMHLDPDFEHLTYGDTQTRGKKLLEFRRNDWVVFYAGLRPSDGQAGLVYALIGLLVVEGVRRVRDIPSSEHDWNAHTRLAERTETDVVVTGRKDLSGRFTRFLEIGEFRSGAYRVRRDLLDAWGGLSVNDGWIQRSANPPMFRNPGLFAIWLKTMSPSLIAANNFASLSL